MTTSLEKFEKWIPSNVRALLHGTPKLTQPVYHHMECAVLFADIPGFTTLSEELANAGAGEGGGGEELCSFVDHVFECVIEAVSSRGGDVVKFAGDAAKVIFVSDGSSVGLRHAAAQAVASGLEIQGAMEAKATKGLIPPEVSKLRVSVSCGFGALALVGGHADKWHWVFGGEVMEKVKYGQEMGPAGIVTVTAETRHQLQDVCHFEPLQDKTAPSTPPLLSSYTSTPTDAPSFPAPLLGPVYLVPPSQSCKLSGFISTAGRLTAAIPTSTTATHESLSDQQSLHQRCLMQLLPDAVSGCIMDGKDIFHWQYHGEVRRISCMFINIGMDFRGAECVGRLHEAVGVIQREIRRNGGTVNKILCDEKGTVVLAGFGLPPFVTESFQSDVITASIDIRRCLMEMEVNCAIGVCTGKAFCGYVGSPSRCEYTVVGQLVNKASRLMSLGKGEKTWVDEATTLGTTHDSGCEYVDGGEVRLKGFRETVRVLEPVAQDEPDCDLLSFSGTYTVCSDDEDAMSLDDSLNSLSGGDWFPDYESDGESASFSRLTTSGCDDHCLQGITEHSSITATEDISQTCTTHDGGEESDPSDVEDLVPTSPMAPTSSSNLDGSPLTSGLSPHQCATARDRSHRAATTKTVDTVSADVGLSQQELDRWVDRTQQRLEEESFDRDFSVDQARDSAAGKEEGGGLSPSSSPHIVHTSTLGNVLRTVIKPPPSAPLVVVHGAAGSGKSYLLSWVHQIATTHSIAAASALEPAPSHPRSTYVVRPVLVRARERDADWTCLTPWREVFTSLLGLPQWHDRRTCFEGLTAPGVGRPGPIAHRMRRRLSVPSVSFDPQRLRSAVFGARQELYCRARTTSQQHCFHCSPTSVNQTSSPALSAKQAPVTPPARKGLKTAPHSTAVNAGQDDDLTTFQDVSGQSRRHSSPSSPHWQPHLSSSAHGAAIESRLKRAQTHKRLFRRNSIHRIDRAWEHGEVEGEEGEGEGNTSDHPPTSPTSPTRASASAVTSPVMAGESPSTGSRFNLSRRRSLPAIPVVHGVDGGKPSDGAELKCTCSEEGGCCVCGATKPSEVDSFVHDILRNDPSVALRNLHVHASLLNLVLPTTFGVSWETEAATTEECEEILLDLCLSLLRNFNRKRSTRPTVVFDDIHWFDALSWRLLERAHREGLEWTFVVSVRDNAVATRHREQTASCLARIEGSVSYSVPKVGERSITALATALLQVDRLSSELREYITDYSSGTLLYCAEYVKHLLQSDQLRVRTSKKGRRVMDWRKWTERCTLSCGHIPGVVEAVVMSQLSALKDEHVATLKVASVIGTHFTLRELAAIHPCGDMDELLDVVGALTVTRSATDNVGDSGVLVWRKKKQKVPEDAQLRFRDRVVRDHLYGLLLDKQKLDLHLRLACHRGEPPPTLALTRGTPRHYSTEIESVMYSTWKGDLLAHDADAVFWWR